VTTPRFLPPHGFLLALGCMALLAIPGSGGLLPGPWRWLGALPVLGGLLLALAGSRQFAAVGTNIVPLTRSSALVTSGVFAWSRNPMYLGMILTLIGLAVMINRTLPWLIVPSFALWLRFRFVRHEESLMEETFGDDYRDYRQRVRRWL